MKSMVASSPTDWPRVAFDDLHVPRLPRINILLIGTADRTSAFIADLLPELNEPIELCEAKDFRPPDQPGTLLLYNATEMPAAGQAALCGWLDNTRGTRVVTTVDRPLFPQVEAGLFLATLYYRLNIVTIDLGVAAPTCDNLCDTAPIQSSSF
jgi:hypothetical protein